MKIYDTSNSSERQQHRSLGGPVENDIVGYLKKYAHRFGHSFTTKEDEADIIFTNDIFPKHLIHSNKPKIKRMDGVYAREDTVHRNMELNLSAQLANHIIFISKFSQLSLQRLYPNVFPQKQTVALNAIDPSIFFPTKDNKKNNAFISTANNWNRTEKRGETIDILAKAFPQYEFQLIGTKDTPSPKNIKPLGYINNYNSMNRILNEATGFIYLGFNDPAPKTLCQALNCHLPCLITNSGGNPEIAEGFSYLIEDFVTSPVFHKKTPSLDENYVIQSFIEFTEHILSVKEKAATYPSKERFETMLETYFNVFSMYQP